MSIEREVLPKNSKPLLLETFYKQYFNDLDFVCQLRYSFFPIKSFPKLMLDCFFKVGKLQSNVHPRKHDQIQQRQSFRCIHCIFTFARQFTIIYYNATIYSFGDIKKLLTIIIGWYVTEILSE